jgi:radical SAM protein (TIGR01212 family)
LKERYRSLSGYLKERFGQRVHKIAIDAGMSCPNRDGTISRMGCVFCNALGSGSGAMLREGLSVREQLARGMEAVGRRFKADKFIAYFQSFTNTYAPVEVLRSLYEEALAFDSVVGLSVATRPDCVSDEVLNLLLGFKERALVWLELGLQSAHDQTLRIINRGHDAACFAHAAERAASLGLSVCSHVILGLPGETREMMLTTARFISSLPIDGVKIHLLHVLKGTELERSYREGRLRCLERGQYVDLVVDFLELLREDIVIHRLTGDPPAGGLVAPQWALDKSENIRLIREALERRDTWQGKKM